ncbi:hypothetical protein [Amphritea balenae]|uniref:PBP domain-containing protein n=1 Tax=Amphritea balenae TaxID=452629 RepID=A0A3P1STF6_9GAMM|nr:hypothetical protein [Amphritea balenae]RRD00484.1 hypothetical protein EHS89_05160 [Amphritea balenae]
MNRQRSQCLKTGLFTGIMMFLCLSVGSSARAESIQIIAHPDQSTVTLSSQNLWAIYGMKTRHWADGTLIKVFVLPTKHPLHRRFSINALKTYPYQLDRVWQRLTYSGTGRAPTVVPSEQAMIEAVTSTPGAIGYINSTTDKGACHVVKVQ